MKKINMKAVRIPAELHTYIQGMARSNRQAAVLVERLLIAGLKSLHKDITSTYNWSHVYSRYTELFSPIKCLKAITEIKKGDYIGLNDIVVSDKIPSEHRMEIIRMLNNKMELIVDIDDNLDCLECPRMDLNSENDTGLHPSPENRSGGILGLSDGIVGDAENLPSACSLASQTLQADSLCPLPICTDSIPTVQKDPKDPKDLKDLKSLRAKILKDHKNLDAAASAVVAHGSLDKTAILNELPKVENTPKNGELNESENINMESSHMHLNSEAEQLHNTQINSDFQNTVPISENLNFVFDIKCDIRTEQNNTKLNKADVCTQIDNIDILNNTDKDCELEDSCNKIAGVASPTEDLRHKPCLDGEDSRQGDSSQQQSLPSDCGSKPCLSDKGVQQGDSIPTAPTEEDIHMESIDEIALEKI